MACRQGDELFAMESKIGSAMTRSAPARLFDQCCKRWFEIAFTTGVQDMISAVRAARAAASTSFVAAADPGLGLVGLTSTAITFALGTSHAAFRSAWSPTNR